MQKDFPGWHRQKEQLHAQHHTPTFQEREIWWCSVGVNIGHEMDGKHHFYNRPVLIVRKFNPHIFFGVPLTTKITHNPYYFPMRFKERTVS
jgi:mRNA interferase MazF